MPEEFNETLPLSAKPRRDVEVTLGPMLLAGLLLGLTLLCAVCFGLGYKFAERGGPGASMNGQPSGADTSSLAACALPKPSATPQMLPDAATTADGQPVTDATGADANPADANTPGAPSAGGAMPPVVKPALAAVTSAPPPVQPSKAVGPVLMVQVAAVSQEGDADVLVSALRKRGYAATARREPADGQFHVRIGPFGNRNDAAAMRQKLMNDGYNAIVQP
jgi:cell division protein FtsN